MINRLIRCCLISIFIFSTIETKSQWDNLKFKHINTKAGLSQNTIQCILEDDLGFLWFGTKDGINKYDSYKFYITRKDPQVENTIFSNDIKAITQDKDKQIWISSLESGSVRIINPITGNISDSKKYNPDQLNLSNIVAIVPTKNGNLLLCSRASGLLIFDHNQKKIKRTTVQESITSAVEDVNGTIWLGTINKGIIHVTKDGKIISSYNNLNNGQKLSPVKVTQLFIDKRNTLWIGTYGMGLLQFDPIKQCLIPVRRPSTDFDLGSRFILSLSEDINGQIWVGTENSGLYILNIKEGKTYAYKHDDQDQSTLGSNSINVIRKDRKGNMWLGTSNSGIAMVNIDDVNILHYRHSKDPSSINNNIINAIFEDSQRNIWIGTDGGGVNIFNKQTGDFINNAQIPFKQIADGSYILSINEDNQGNIWIGTWSNGAYIVNLKNKTIRNINTQNTPELKSNSIMAILKDKHEKMWVGTYGGGISVFNPEKNSWVNFLSDKTDNSINSNHILCLFEDRNNNILVGTESGGLNVYNPELGQFKIINTQSALKGDKLTNNNVNTIDEDQNGDLWVGTSYGLNRIHLQKYTNRAYLTSNSDLLSDVVRAVITDLFGDIWIATTKGVSRLQVNSNTFTNYTLSTGLQDDEFRNGKLLDKDGDIYFGGKNGFNILDPKDKKSSPFSPSLVFSNFELNNSPVPISNANLQTPLKQSITYTDKITLDYDQNSIAFEFSTLNYIDPEIKKYKYKLEGLDKEWQSLNSKNYISFANIPPGNYTLLIKGLDNDGKWSNNEAKMDIIINPPWWLTWWFKSCMFLLLATSVVGLYLNRVKNIRNKNKILEEKIALKTEQLFVANNELRKNNEDTLAKNLILEQKNKEIEAINEMKDKFFSILAHDLRNPISAISGLTDLLKSNMDQLTKQELEDYIDDLVLSSHSVNNLLINLLEWGKSKSNKLFFKPAAFNLFEAVKKNIYLFNIAIQEKNIDITVNIQSDEHIYADYQMISTIIRNILNNSIKFSHRNGKISFDATIDEEIILRIKDNGVGMTKQQVKDIFSNQTKPTKGTSGETGTGLGFQICREFISAHHGELQIQSELGTGTEFIIKIPILKNVDSIKKSISDLALDETPVFSKFEGKKILIIDDNKVLRNLIRRSLEKNFRIEEAENGVEGLSMATSTQPDLIISDLIMPQMDGLSLCKILKSKVETSHIPVLMLTGEQDEEQQILGYNAGADIYLTKPFNNKLLHTVIHNFLSKQVTVQKKIFSTQPDALENDDISTVDKEFLETINQFILENLNDYELDYKKISNHMSVSRSVLYAKFKTLTGQGVHDYIKNIRLVESLKLLKQGRLTISQIAYEVGFNSISYYSKSFSKEMKMSPKQYQKEIQHDK